MSEPLPHSWYWLPFPVQQFPHLSRLTLVHCCFFVWVSLTVDSHFLSHSHTFATLTTCWLTRSNTNRGFKIVLSLTYCVTILSASAGISTHYWYRRKRLFELCMQGNLLPTVYQGKKEGSLEPFYLIFLQNTMTFIPLKASVTAH